jgi:ribosome-associated heat shock protein Hsp15
MVPLWIHILPFKHEMNDITQPVRMDKWLWAIRLFKTRSLATDSCKNGRVTINGQPVKPSRDVRIGETIRAQTGDITRTVKVISLLHTRVGATLVPQYAEDLTPATEFDKPRLPNYKPIFVRPKGSGRPTKKERRDFERLSGEND